MNIRLVWISDSSGLVNALSQKLDFLCEDVWFSHFKFDSPRDFLTTRPRSDLLILDCGELGPHHSDCDPVLMRILTDSSREIVLISGFDTKLFQSVVEELREQYCSCQFYLTNKLTDWVIDEWLPVYSN